MDSKLSASTACCHWGGPLTRKVGIDPVLKPKICNGSSDSRHDDAVLFELKGMIVTHSNTYTEPVRRMPMTASFFLVLRCNDEMTKTGIAKMITSLARFVKAAV